MKKKKNKEYLLIIRVVKQKRKRSHGIVLKVEARSVGSACLKAYYKAKNQVNARNRDFGYSFEVVMVVESSKKRVLGSSKEVIEEFGGKNNKEHLMLGYGTLV